MLNYQRVTCFSHVIQPIPIPMRHPKTSEEVRWIQKQLCSHWGLDVSECLANAQKPRHADGEDDSTSDHW